MVLKLLKKKNIDLNVDLFFLYGFGVDVIFIFCFRDIILYYEIVFFYCFSCWFDFMMWFDISCYICDSI